MKEFKITAEALPSGKCVSGVELADNLRDASFISRKEWKYNITDLCALVDYDKRFIRNLVNLETDKKRKAYLRKRFLRIVNFSYTLENYLETLDILSDQD